MSKLTEAGGDPIMQKKSCAVVLAAGEGKRMKSNCPKVLSEVLFKPMLGWVLDAVRASSVRDICCVVGYRHEQVEAYLKQLNAGAFSEVPIQHVLQSEQHGTGHAVMMARSFLEEHQGGQVLILNGDAPFVTAETIDSALQRHLQSGSSATVISAKVENPFGYGRIVRNPKTRLLKSIVEQKDADQEVQKIREINSGSFWFCVDDLLGILSEINSNNAQGEYYLTDAIALLLSRGKKADAFLAEDSASVLGANDCLQLSQLNTIARERILQKQREAGISIPCSDGVIIGPDVTIGPYSCILPGSILQGTTSVGRNCIIGPNAILHDSQVSDDVKLNSVQVYNRKIAKSDFVLPYTVLQ